VLARGFGIVDLAVGTARPAADYALSGRLAYQETFAAAVIMRPGRSGQARSRRSHGDLRSGLPTLVRGTIKDLPEARNYNCAAETDHGPPPSDPHTAQGKPGTAYAYNGFSCSPVSRRFVDAVVAARLQERAVEEDILEPLGYARQRRSAPATRSKAAVIAPHGETLRAQP